MRKLVTIRKILAITEIPGAHAIECLRVDGWQVVATKGEFVVGDDCVYFEIDSFLPSTDPRFEFLNKNQINWENQLGVRIRTIRLRGQVSQGLALPLRLFPELSGYDSNSLDNLNQDHSKVLGVKKWEATIPACLSGEVLGVFPEFIRKTDQERVQNLLEVLADDVTEYEVTIKLDGSSMTVFYNNTVAGVCGRNWWLRDTVGNSLWECVHKNNLMAAISEYGRNIAIQGEIIGEGIQGNGEKLKGRDFQVFDIFDIDRQHYMGYQERNQVLGDLTKLGAVLTHVPVLEITSLGKFNGNVQNILDYSQGPSLNPRTSREGLVFKKLDGSFSFKAISNSYLIKNPNF